MEEKEGVSFLVLYKAIYLSSFGFKHFQADPYIFLLDAVCRLERFWGFEANHFSFRFSYQIRVQISRLVIFEEKSEMENECGHRARRNADFVVLDRDPFPLQSLYENGCIWQFEVF